MSAPGSVHTPDPRPLAAPTLPIRRALASVGVAVLYLVVLVLMRIAPPRSAQERRAAGPDGAEPGGSRAIRWSVALYRFSAVHGHFQRKGGRCMFLPSCSDYALRAGEKYGLWRALMMIGDRFRRCRADTCDDYVDFP